MRGVPRILKTREDVETMMELYRSGALRPQHHGALLGHLQAFLDSRYVMERDRELGPDEEPDGPEPHYRVLIEEDGTRVQYKRVESETGRIYRLGLTVDEVSGWIGELEAAE